MPLWLKASARTHVTLCNACPCLRTLKLMMMKIYSDGNATPRAVSTCAESNKFTNNAYRVVYTLRADYIKAGHVLMLL